MVKWKVVPLCIRQRRDVNPKDIVLGGLFRFCNSYKSGGGYDKFPEIYERRFGVPAEKLGTQFVVQLYGCSMNCPYCYVTRDGVCGNYVEMGSRELIEAFQSNLTYSNNCSIFHLMGGAPALYLNDWEDIMCRLGHPYVFHSDFVLNESEYDKGVLERIAKYDNALFAANIKGISKEEFECNTKVPFNEELILRNLCSLWECGINFYITFTGIDLEAGKQYLIEKLPWKYIKGGILNDAFSINIVDYEALKP